MTKKKVMRSPRVPSPLNRLHSTPVAALLLGSDRNDQSGSEPTFERPASRYITICHTCNQRAILCKLVSKDKCGCCKAAGISRLKHACGAGHKRCPKNNSRHPPDLSHPLHIGLAQVRWQQLPRCFCKATLDCVAHMLHQK